MGINSYMVRFFAGEVVGLAASRVKFYMQAARHPKSLDTPLKGNVNSYAEEGDLLVDSIAADNGVDEKALDLQRWVTA